MSFYHIIDLRVEEGEWRFVKEKYVAIKVAEKRKIIKQNG